MSLDARHRRDLKSTRGGAAIAVDVRVSEVIAEAKHVCVLERLPDNTEQVPSVPRKTGKGERGGPDLAVELTAIGALNRRSE
jgi:hypothetical protein